jgi:uncharacterized protein (TIGR00255 family)
MTRSMTGFASLRGEGSGYAWAWDLRSVNGKGLDLRLRVPDWIDGLEAALRGELQRALQRGSVSLTLKVSRDLAGAEAFRVNPGALRAALSALTEVETAARAAGVKLVSASPAEVLALRGVTDAGPSDEDTGPLRTALLADLPPLLAQFDVMRVAEGTTLAGILTQQLDRIAALTEAAAGQAHARRDAMRNQLQDAVAKLLAQADGVDEARLMQELALIAVKNDVTEEIDRLGAHITAARALLAEPGQIGRRFEFLVQEFMREANTLCSKAQAEAMTRIGLDLKAVIDQMREQVQNVE